MGDRLRKYTRQLIRIAFRAALPALIIFGILLGSFVLRGTPHNIDFPPLVYLRLLITCYATAFITTCVLEYRALVHAASRPDEHLIGKNFSGFRAVDKRFCEGMELFAANHTRQALDIFLEVQSDYTLTAEETGVLSFYLGRCYQILHCPSNAVTYYRKARDNGFSAPFSMLFEARSCAEGGDFETGFALFQTLIDSDPPTEFYFLYTDVGYLFLKQKKPDLAIEWFQKSIAEQKNYAFALSGMAIASLQKGDFPAAQDYHYKALINRLEDPTSFRKYYEETKNLMLEQHPEWSPKTGAMPEKTEQTE